MNEGQHIPRRINPITAAGVLLILVAGTALTTYLLVVGSSRVKASSGPPQQFLAAATAQAQQRQAGGATLTPSSPASVDTASAANNRVAVPNGTVQPTPTLLVGIPDSTVTPTSAAQPDTSTSSLPEWVTVDYWITIPAISVDAPVMGLAPREHEVDGTMVLRMPVPDGYVVGWDNQSAAPGQAGNTILTGHNNLWGAVFGDLEKLNTGDEIALWTPLGVFSYYVRQTLYLEDKDQPLDVQVSNAQWIQPTSDVRLTLVSCWPRKNNTHRLVIIATP